MHVTPSVAQPVCSFPGCNPTATDAHGNTAGGSGSLQNVVNSGNPEGVSNTAFGYVALHFNTLGSENTAIGNSALFSNTTGGGNTASGHAALTGNTTGNFNTADGAGSLSFNTTGTQNTAMGSAALLGNTSGSDNTASGFQALTSNTAGKKNTAVGGQALLHSSGSKNIAIWYRAGFMLGSGNNNIYLGNPGAIDDSLTMRLGSVQTSTFIAGIVTAGVDGATVQVDHNGQLGIAPSSARYKQDIAPMGIRSEKMLDLRPVTFSYKDGAQGVTHYGLIAEEVATVYPDLVTRTAAGEVQTVKYQELIPMLLNELQRQHQVLQSQQQELAELRALVGQGRGKVVLGGTVE